MAVNINAYYRLARLDKPAGAWLLLLPCWFGLALAGNLQISLYILFAIGAFVMRAAGCVVNDIADRKFDALVERTKNRPLASGEISLTGGLIFLALLLLVGLGVLIQLPMLAITIGFASVPLFVTYPVMKRFTYWPQFFLGLTFNIGILIAYASATGTISFEAVALYIGAIFWTLGYDTIYAHQDKADDLEIGVKSTAIKLAGRSKFFIAVFYTLFIVIFGTALESRFGLRLMSFTALCLAALHFTWQVWRLDINNPRNCMLLFKSNIYAGLILVFALITANISVS